MENEVNDEIKIVKSNERIVQKKCPSCGANEIKVNPTTGKLRCDYCGYEFEQEKVEGFVSDIQNLHGTVVGAGAQNINNNSTYVVACKCTGCGAEIILNANEVPYARCHWCNTGLSLNQQVPTGTVPDAILPFKISKEEAFQSMKEIVDKKTFFADKTFLEEFSIDNLKGVYLPFMAVDINAHAKFKGKAHKITKRRYAEDENGDQYVRSYDYDVYNVEREFDIQIENLLQTAGNKQYENWKNIENLYRAEYILKTLMPFDIENCVKWDGNFLDGYSIEKRSSNIGDIADNAGLKAKDIARHRINGDLNYDGGVNWESEELEINGQQWKSIYLPVWIYSYTQHVSGKDYTYFIVENARTGEINYRLPCNIKKVIISLLLSLAFLPIAIIVLGMLFGYTHIDERNRHEIDTKSRITNINRVDEYKKHKIFRKQGRVKGANNDKIEGDD